MSQPLPTSQLRTIFQFGNCYFGDIAITQSPGSINLLVNTILSTKQEDTYICIKQIFLHNSKGFYIIFELP